MVFINILRVVKSIIKILFYKVIFGNRITISHIKGTFLGRGFSLDINDKTSTVKIGSLICRANTNIKVTKGKLIIGNNVFLNNGCSINCRKNIEIGNNCLLGEGVKIYDHDHKFKLRDGLIRNQDFTSNDVVIGENVWIGSNVVILKGTIIGDNCVIGAGSIVNGHIESGSIYYNKREKFIAKIVDNNSIL